MIRNTLDFGWAGFIATLVLGSSLLSLPARADTLRVGADGIQAAIDRAEPGDVIEVPAGTYREHVVLNKTITLRGLDFVDGVASAILDGGGEGTVLRVSAPNARVEHMGVQNSGNDLGAPDVCIYVEPEAVDAIITYNQLLDCSFGIWIHTTVGVEVSHNNVQGRPHLRVADRGNGIHLFDASRLRVVHNVVEGSRDGIYVSATEDSVISYNVTDHQRYGIHYMFSYRNTLRYNQANHNVAGLALMESRGLTVEYNVTEHNEEFGLLFRDAQSCTIRRNRMVENGQGMFFFSSADNVIVENELIHNDVGAKIWAGSHRNEVRGNAFIGNRQQVFFVGATDLVWGDAREGEGEGGNFWSDYVGWDQDGDGFGDLPHRLDSFTTVLIHRYPAAALLLRSPALELLSHLESQMPLLTVATVIDNAPLMARR